RAQALGVTIRFQTEHTSVEAYPDADLIVASDGCHSVIRQEHAAVFKPDLEVRKNKYIWFGTHQTFDAFTFAFEETPHGWIWAHAYKFDGDTSTFIVECQEPTWRALGLDTPDQAQSIALCERLFAKYLGGHALLTKSGHLRGSAWLNFPRIHCAQWHHGNIVLMGDAAHTAHFSIGSGTKLALEDAIFLADALHSPAYANREAVFAAYQETRRVEVLKLQSAARNSTEWFENVPRYARLEPVQFAYSLLTRSQRVSHENLRLRDRPWLEGVERWFAARSGAPKARRAPPPMFTPYRVRELTLVNRVAVAPMDTYLAKDGTPGDFHLVHYGARAQGGAGLLFTEMTCVTADGRITPGCAGMYAPEHVVGWKRIVDFVHAHSPAKIALQLGHSGPKGSTKIGWEGTDQPLDAGNWPLLAPSAVAWSPQNQVPHAMTAADLDRVRDAFVASARMGEQAGFDMLELHCAHGYLLSAFITPLTNKRTDEFGGVLASRLRFPLSVFAAIRAEWPAEKPISVRISASDWVADAQGVDATEAVEIARAFKAAGADLIHVSSGQTSTQAQPVYGRMYQTPFSDRIRHEAGVPTIAVGNIYEFDHVNSIIAAGRADLCSIARPHLADPYWTLHAAAQQDYRGIEWPLPYLAGRDQLYRNLKKANEAAIHV
ncbi:MAG: bifunctional salicylyl-CoA 5-hydroxylase/oxidoreductase, partial [Proteobacteria bacterium]|nr:bifunctional salicylyl-CoA 5-hydroxylase/oxidoreductase [Pseudomonadota bacterium]